MMSIVRKISKRIGALRCRLRRHAPAFDRSWGHDQGQEITRCTRCGTLMERKISGGWRLHRPANPAPPQQEVVTLAEAKPAKTRRLKMKLRKDPPAPAA